MEVMALERTLTELDHVRLLNLLRRHRRSDGLHPPPLSIEQVLDACTIVPSRQTPPDVVTMSSQVLLLELETAQRRQLTLCYPADAEPAAGFVSVLSPLGASLLGLRAGSVARWSTPTGEERAAEILNILFQPEASGDYAMQLNVDYSLGLLGGWLLLSRSFSIGQVLMGVAVAVAMPLLIAPLRPRPGPLRRWGLLARLVLCVGRDVLWSATQVAAGVWRARAHPPRGAFVVIPLELRNVHALAALAMITAVVPGTVWSELAPDRSAVLIHVFDLDDEAAFIQHFKTDYEQPLKEIFE